VGGDLGISTSNIPTGFVEFRKGTLWATQRGWRASEQFGRIFLVGKCNIVFEVCKSVYVYYVAIDKTEQNVRTLSDIVFSSDGDVSA
jgi:hypothetical protein